MAETKPTLIVEKSESIRQFPPQPNNRWYDMFNEDQLAVHASAAEGTDLWADWWMHERLFFSDRLKRAIEAARIKSRGLTLVEATVIA